MDRLLVVDRDLGSAFWSLSLCPDAGEGGGSFVPSLARRHSTGVRGQARDLERSRSEAARRARGRLRRYCAANRLTRLGTLTYAGEGVFDPAQVRVDAGKFFRSLRDRLGGEPFPYVWVPEWHRSHGLHLHFAVGRFIPVGLIRRAWGRGHVHIKLISDLPVGSGPREEARKAAGYLSKYVTKTFEDHEHPVGRHRYEPAEGFQPAVEKLTASSLNELLSMADERMGARPAYSWFSRDQLGWQGPPAFWVAW